METTHSIQPVTENTAASACTTQQRIIVKKYKYPTFKLGIVAFLFGATLTIHAQTSIGYHPNAPLVIGQGLDPRQTANKPFVATAAPLTVTSGATAGANFAAYYSQHKLDLTKHFSLSAAVTARNAVAKVTAGVSFSDSVDYSEDTINYIFECDRDYGTTRLENFVPRQSFLDSVNVFKQTLQGEQLHNRVVKFFGSHFVSGYRSKGKILINYSFKYSSKTSAKSIAASFNGKYGTAVSGVSFVANAESFFKQTDTNVEMTYQFYNSDSTAPILTYPKAKITSYADFLDFSATVTSYCNTYTNSATAMQTEYFIEPIVNLGAPYLSLLDGYFPGDSMRTDYDRFLESFGLISQWEDRLTFWLSDPKRMNWMNSTGTNFMDGLRKDVSTYRRSMQDIANRHFTNNEPLVVTDEFFNYAANFSRIPIPEIGLLDVRYNPTDPGPQPTYFIGVINAGLKERTSEYPFVNVYATDPSGRGLSTWAVYWDPQDFENYLDAEIAHQNCCIPPSNPPGFRYNLSISYLRNSPSWPKFKAAADKYRLGFFMLWLQNPPAGQFNGLHVFDATSPGNIVEKILLDGSNTGANAVLPSSYTGGSSTQTVVNLASTARSAMAIVDGITYQEFAVTNNGPSAAFNIVATVPIPPQTDVVSIAGTQGGGVFINGNVIYDIGPLANGGVAKIKIGLAFQSTGQKLASAAAVSLPVLLANVGTNSTVTTEPVSVQAPTLNQVRGTNRLELKWVSDTGKLGVESIANLNGGLWSGVTNSITESGLRVLRLPLTNASGFFRLKSQ